MSTSEARQIASKVARGVLPYNVGCKQAAVRHTVREFNSEYRRLVGDERYVAARDEYLDRLYHSLGLQYKGTDAAGEPVDEEEGDGEIEALKQRIQAVLSELGKQRETALREERRLEGRAAACRREIGNLPPFWFNAVFLAVFGAAIVGIVWKVSFSPVPKVLALLVGLLATGGMGVYDYLRFRRTVEGLEAREADLVRKAARQAGIGAKLEEQRVKKQAEFDLLCNLLTRSFDLNEFLAVPEPGQLEEVPKAEPDSGEENTGEA